jgi:hypothetical protein
MRRLTGAFLLMLSLASAVVVARAASIRDNGRTTAITISEVSTFTATYDPASLAAGTARCDAVTVTGITTTGGAVVANIGAVDPATGCVMSAVRVTADDTVEICWRNAIDAVTSCNVDSSTWKFSQAQ